MKCDKVSFSYRGTSHAGKALAEILSEISVDYASADGRVTGSADLGAFLRDGHVMSVRGLLQETTVRIPLQ